MNRIISLITSLCFIVTNVCLGIDIPSSRISGNDRNLATPLRTCKSLSAQARYDIARIETALLENLEAWHREGLTNAKVADFKSFYQRDDIHFFFEGRTETDHGTHVMCRINDEGLREYHVYFRLTKNEQGIYPIKIFTKEEYEQDQGFTNGLPERDKGDADSIQRDVQHEEGIDTVLRYAHTHDLAKTPISERWNYKDTVTAMCKMVNVHVTTPAGLIPIEERKVFLVNLTELKKHYGEKELAKLLETELVDKDMNIIKDLNTGLPLKVACVSHSSNNAVHILIDEDLFEYATNQNSKLSVEDVSYKSFLKLHTRLSYEIGVMLGYAPGMYSADNPINTFIFNRPFTMPPSDDFDLVFDWPTIENLVMWRYLAQYFLQRSGGVTAMAAENATVVDLRGRIDRDFAMGETLPETVVTWIRVEGTRTSKFLSENESQKAARLQNMTTFATWIVALFDEINPQFTDQTEKARLLQDVTRRLWEEEHLSDGHFSFLFPRDRILQIQGEVIHRLLDAAKDDTMRERKNAAFRFLSYLLMKRDFAGNFKLVNVLPNALQIDIVDGLGKIAGVWPNPMHFRGSDFTHKSCLQAEILLEDIANSESASEIARQRALQILELIPANRLLDLAAQVGKQIAPPVQKYTVYVTDDFISSDDYSKDANTSRFDLVRLNKHNTHDIADDILGKIERGELSGENVVVQFSKDHTNSETDKEILERLNANNVKFTIVNTTGIKDNEKRQQYRENIYSIMLLTRLLDDDLKLRDETLYKNAYQLLEHFVRQHIIGEGDRADLSEECVQALISGNVLVLLQRILNVVPIEPFEMPNRETVAAVLMSA